MSDTILYTSGESDLVFVKEATNKDIASQTEKTTSDLPNGGPSRSARTAPSRAATNAADTSPNISSATISSVTPDEITEAPVTEQRGVEATARFETNLHNNTSKGSSSTVRPRSSRDRAEITGKMRRYSGTMIASRDKRKSSPQKPGQSRESELAYVNGINHRTSSETRMKRSKLYFGPCVVHMLTEREIYEDIKQVQQVL